jgi:hypothetical protein
LKVYDDVKVWIKHVETTMTTAVRKLNADPVRLHTSSGRGS